VDDDPGDVLGRLRQSIGPLQDRLEGLADDPDIDRRQGRDQICDDYYRTHVNHAEQYLHETLRSPEDRLNAAWISERQAPEAGTTPCGWLVNQLAKTWTSQAKELTRVYPVLYLVIDADRRFGEEDGFAEAERRTRIRFRELCDGGLREPVPFEVVPPDTSALPIPAETAAAAENVDSGPVPATQSETKLQRGSVPKPVKQPSEEQLVERRRKLHRLTELCGEAKGHKPNQTEVAVLLGYNNYSTITKYLRGTGSEGCAQRIERILILSKDEIKSEIEHQTQRLKRLPAKLPSKANSNPPR
jgi:hypothetical protein